MTSFTQSQLDAMVRDADIAAKRVLGDSTLADVCVHVKALASEVGRLQSIVDRLPTTADGVPVVPGIDRVWHPDFQGAGTPRDERFAYWACYNRGIGTCYSTREAAEKARSSR